MLKDIDAIPTIAVKNIDAARSFYEDMLGLKLDGEGQPGLATCRSGSTRILMYESEFAGTNQASALTWDVGGQFDAIVQDLQSKGVPFEHYEDLPGLTLVGDVHVGDDFKGVWFKDPDGNTLHINSV